MTFKAFKKNGKSGFSVKVERILTAMTLTPFCKKETDTNAEEQAKNPGIVLKRGVTLRTKASLLPPTNPRQELLFS